MDKGQFSSYHDEPQDFGGEDEEVQSGGTPGVASGEYNDLQDVNMMVGVVAVGILFSGFLGALFFVICEKYNRFIRFWAWQTLFSSSILFLVQVINFFGLLFAYNPRPYMTSVLIFTILHFIGAALLSWYAYKGARTGQLFKLPVIGQMALSRALNAGPPSQGARLQLL